MNMLIYTETKQSPLQRVFGTYRFLLADYREGLVYGVGQEIIDQAEEVLSEKLGRVITLNIKNSEDFIHSIYPLLKEAS